MGTKTTTIERSVTETEMTEAEVLEPEMTETTEDETTGNEAFEKKGDSEAIEDADASEDEDDGESTGEVEIPLGGLIGGFTCEWEFVHAENWSCVADLLNFVSRVTNVVFHVIGYERHGEWPDARVRVRVDCCVRRQDVVSDPKELARKLKETLETVLGETVKVRPLRMSADSPDDVYSLRKLYHSDRQGPSRFYTVSRSDFVEREDLDAHCRYRQVEAEDEEGPFDFDDDDDDDDCNPYYHGTLRFDGVVEEELLKASLQLLFEDAGLRVECLKSEFDGDAVVDEVIVEPTHRRGMGRSFEIEYAVKYLRRYLGCKAELRLLGHTIATPEDVKLIAAYNGGEGPRFMRQPKGDESFKFMPESTKPDHRSATEIFNGLVGLGDVERRIREAVAFAKARKAMDGKRPVLHMCFTGNPGVGKTTVARAMGRLLHEEGLMEDPDKFVEVDREKLVARYVGWTAKTTKEMIEKAKGGILFVDEAYSLDAGTRHDFGPEAVSTLVKAMEDDAQDLIVVLAGYTEPMEKMVKMNPGLRDRIAFNIEFQDYTADELMEIGRRMAEAEGYGFTNEALRLLEDHVHELVGHKDEAFANARLMRKVIERAAIRQAAIHGEDPTFDEDVIRSIFADGDLGKLPEVAHPAGF